MYQGPQTEKDGRSGAGTCTEILRIVKTGNGDDNFY